MLKRLDKWLDSWNEFSDDHCVFSAIVDTVMLFVALVLLISGFAVFVKLTDHEHSDVLWEGGVQMSDTRTVHCIATKDGLSCDWVHASGADKR